MFELLSAGQAVYTELKNVIVWNKTNAGMGTFYRSKHELVVAFKHGRAAHINNFELGQHGRYRSNVWSYPGVNAFGSNRLEELQMHPTVKPVALIADAIRDCSTHGSIILDCFAGSGTTLIACEDTARMARCIELDPLYVDVAIKRWQRHTNQHAVHAESGRTFDSMCEERSGEVHHA